MKKRIITAMLSMVLAVTMAVPVAAAEPNRGTTNLNASKASTFTLSIPIAAKDITYGDENTSLGNLKVTGNVNVGEQVSVTVETNAFKRIGSESDTITFTLMDTTGKTPAAYTTTTWSEAELRAKTPKKVPLSVNIPEEIWEAAKSGSYTGSIVFTATLSKSN